MARATRARGLGGDDCRARTHKRVVDRLSSIQMMEDRSAHTLDGFGCAVMVLGFFVGSRFDMPQRGLTAIAFPLGVGAFADEIKASFVLPMIMGTTDGEVALGPNNLTLRLKPADRERLLHLPCK